jgi:hypothetical protein
MLARAPGLDEIFKSGVFCVLRKSGESARGER